MWPFPRRPRWRLEVPADPVVPGREVAVRLVGEHLREGTRLDEVAVSLRCSGRRPVDTPQGEHLQASSVSTDVTWSSSRLSAGRDLRSPDDAVDLAIRVPWFAPVSRVGDAVLLGYAGGPEVVVRDVAAHVEVAALPFHDALFAAADTLGWRYRRCEIWDVGGRRRPVEQRLLFAPDDDARTDGFTLAHLEVVPVATGETAGTVAITLVGRKLGPGLFPLGRLPAVRLDAADSAAFVSAIREGVAGVLADPQAPPGVALDGAFVEAVLRVLLRG